MKMAIVTIVLALFISTQAASLPGRETDRIGVQLMGYTPPPCPVDYGPYLDYIVNCSGQPWHYGGLVFGFIAWAEDSSGELITQSGVGFTVANIQSGAASPENYPAGINNWPTVGKVVDCASRKAASTIRTNKYGRVNVGLCWGSMTIADAVPICSSEGSISTRATGTLQLKTNHIPGYLIGAEWFGRQCTASIESPDSRCGLRPDGYSWIGRQATRIATMSMDETPGIMQMSEMVLATDGEDVNEAVRLPQAALEWPGVGWQRLALDNTWDTWMQTGMAVLTFDPNEPKRDALSATEAWVYCDEIGWPGQPARLARIMQGYSVGMNRHSDNRYISDYLFYADNAVHVGPQIDDANNPCYILPLTQGQTIEPELPDANVPDVIGSWLGTGRSDLNADGIVDGADYAISANNYGLQ